MIRFARKLGKLDYVQKYEGIRESLKQALNSNAWDGEWFKRAFMDSGKALGSKENSECRIDSIAQSWAVISGAGEKDKVMTAISNLEKFLIDKETRYY